MTDTIRQALEKLKHYCAYQDRCHAEVIQKLKQLGVWGNDADEVIAMLITENYLDEERYARNFARGKFRMKQWGRKKILSALKSKNISAYCIKKAMQEIEEDEYKQTLMHLAKQKYLSLKNEQYLRRKYKTSQYLINKGYEPELVWEALKEMADKN